MFGWWLAAAFAGALGPDEVGTGDTGLEEAPECGEIFPYALAQLPDWPSSYRRNDPRRSWGTPALIEAIQDAAGRVALEFPDSAPLFVGDMSTRQGGPLPPHRYHHDGRSVDLGLFGPGGTQPVSGFAPLASSQLDPERTWLLIHGLLLTGQVEHILLDQRHIDRLKAWLRESGTLPEPEIRKIFPPLDTPRLWSYQSIVRHASRHGDHLHVRLRCADTAAP